MTANLSNRVLLAGLSAIVTCTALSFAHGFVQALASVGALCCHAFGMGVVGHAAMGLIGMSVAGILVASSLGAFSLRVWRTQRLVHILTRVQTEPPARLLNLATTLNLSPSLLLFSSPAPLAFCFGLWRPRIAVSTGLMSLLTDRELKAVLLHEDHHRRRHDPLRGLLAEVGAATFFFLPISAQLRDWFMASLELAADRYAISFTGRPPLAGALHKLLTHSTALPASVAGVIGLSATDARLAQLLDRHSPELRLSLRRVLASSALLLLACMLLPRLLF